MNTAAELAEEIRTRSADAAARKLEQFAPTEIASALMQLTPAFAQDVLAALPDAQRELLFPRRPTRSRANGSATRSTGTTPSAA